MKLVQQEKLEKLAQLVKLALPVLPEKLAQPAQLVRLERPVLLV